MSNLFATISKAIQEGNQTKTVDLIKAALVQNTAPLDILNKGMIPGIEALGEQFKTGELFLPEILISARAMNMGTEVLKPYLPQGELGKRGTVVIGTVEGDLHDIGKNLVKTMLECSSFRVVDLGVDVAAESFVRACREHNADVIALSALLTTTMTNMPKVIESLKSAGLRDRVKVIIGGAPVTRAYAERIGAEGYAEDCTGAIKEVRQLVRE